MKKIFIITLSLLCVKSFALNIYDVEQPMILCSTSSNGKNFSDESRNISVAKSEAISHCTSNSRTTNSECRANISCNDGSYYDPMTSCKTSSNGRHFSDESRNRSLARRQAVSHCTAHSQTTDSECRANVICDNESASQANHRKIIKCSTSSNKRNFSDESRDISVARVQAISHCTAHSQTNDRECRANISCNDGSYYSPMITCATSSNGRNFLDKSRDVSLAKMQAISHCTSHSRTTDTECRANIYCNDTNIQRPMISCSTSSNGRNFSDESRDISVARTQAISHCTGHSRTNNRECRANIYCSVK